VVGAATHWSVVERVLHALKVKMEIDCCKTHSIFMHVRAQSSTLESLALSRGHTRESKRTGKNELFLLLNCVFIMFIMFIMFIIAWWAYIATFDCDQR
jgi:hypothetical protein